MTGQVCRFRCSPCRRAGNPNEARQEWSGWIRAAKGIAEREMGYADTHIEFTRVGNDNYDTTNRAARARPPRPPRPPLGYFSPSWPSVSHSRLKRARVSLLPANFGVPPVPKESRMVPSFVTARSL
jgi:hypothetical protein